MRNTGLEEAQTGIKIAGRNINNLRYADDTIFMAESEEELKSLLMKVKEESEKVTAHQASLSMTNSRSLLKLKIIELVMPSSHLILCHPILLLPPIPPSIRVFSNESTLRMK